jgi:Tfp pilus assembly protein PilF/TolB-like protein
LRNPVFIFSILLLSLATAGAQQAQPLRSTQMLMIMPFENASKVPGIDWIGESFPEVLGNRLDSTSLFLISRDDRLYAFDRLGIPATAKPSRATIYQVAQQIDADYVVVGRYSFDGSIFTARAQVMDLNKLRLSPELIEAGPLTSLISLQTALTWDVLNTLNLTSSESKSYFVAQFPPIRLDALENYIRGILAGNEQERVQHFKEAIRLEPNHTMAKLQLARTYYNAREYEPAVVWFSKVPLTDRKANEAQFFLGLAAYYAGQFDKAEAAFRFLEARLPLTEVSNNLGVVASRRGEKNARSYFEKSIQTDPNDVDYHFNLAVELYREGDTSGAIRQLRETLALRPDSEARNFLDTLVSATQPSAQTGVQNKERLPLERIKRNYDESSFRQLVAEIDSANEARLQKSDPATHADFHAQRGVQLLEQGLVSEAEKELREAVMLNPANAEAHTGMARVLESDQDNQAARNEARVALRLKPTAEAYLVLARLDLADRNTASAQQNVEHALALDPANAAATSLKREIAATISGKAEPQH